ncbi:MAG: response regulator [Planctomycetota bacterium]
MRTIVIDDSRAIRSILRRILTDLGFEVLEAGNGKEALSTLAASGPVELALVDWNMPEMNGYEFLKAFRADPSSANTKIIMVTTETGTEEMIKAIEAGANEYVMKPFDKEMIASKLEILGIPAC